MKKTFTLFALAMLVFAGKSEAQLTDGSTAPNFTFADINGKSHTLYTYLNEGKYVAMDVFATWCGPCWYFHSLGVMDSLYEIYDDAGLKQWKVMQVEGDGTTDDADLKGTGSNTNGDWTENVDYTTIDPADGAALNNFESGYQISYFPTLYLIGPNKKVYNMMAYMNNVDFPGVRDWEEAAKKFFNFAPAGIDAFDDSKPVTIYPNPAHGAAGIYFHLNSSSDVKLAVSNVMGQTIGIKDLGRLAAGDQDIKYDLGSLPAGIYYFTVSAENSRSITQKLVVQ